MNVGLSVNILITIKDTYLELTPAKLWISPADYNLWLFTTDIDFDNWIGYSIVMVAKGEDDKV